MLADAGSPTILSYVPLLFSSTDWQYQSALIAAPAGATIARIVLGLQDSTFNIGTGSYLIDGVTLVGAKVPGDYNSDGRVTLEDYDVWRNTFGSLSELSADGNGDRRVDAADFVFWRDRLNDPSLNGVFDPDLLTVPEPSMCGGLVLASLAAWAASRRGRQAPCRRPVKAWRESVQT